MNHEQSPREQFPKLAIVGMGCLFPKADNLSAYWANIREGVDAITEVPATHWRPEDYFSSDPKAPDHTYGKRGGFLSAYPFNPMAYGMPPSTLEGTDTSQLLGMVAAEQAMIDAGYGPGREFNRDRVSVILGVTGALELVVPLGARLGHPIWRRAMLEAGIPQDQVDDAVKRIGDGYVPWQEASFPGLLGNVVAGRISKHLDFGGTNCVVDAACASSLSAIHLAALELGAGHADMAVTGGIDTFNDIFMYMCFSKTPALSASGDAKPFDVNGDGTILGEGLGVLVMKRLEDAERDGDTIYAVLKGIGSSSDGKGDAIYAPNAAGQQEALKSAYEIAGVTPDSIELLEAHGTGTKVGDAVEARALREVYSAAGRDGSWCALGSIKSQIGHTKAAAGAAGLMKAALALRHKVLPPTIKVSEPLKEVAPGTSPFYVNTEKRPWVASDAHPRRAAVSAFGFGGSNFHAVLEEHGAAKPAPDWDGDVQIVALSAQSKSALKAKLEALPTNDAWIEWRAAAQQSRATFTPSDPHRLLLVIEKGSSDLAKLKDSAAKLLDQSASFSSSPDGAWYGSGTADGQLAMLFPGQGAQYVGMLRDLVCMFPEALDTIEHANDAIGLRLSDIIYPHPAFDDATRKQHEETLRATNNAQPALGAVSLAALRVLARFGVKPTSVAGHSYGELTALAAAGCINEPDFFRISRLRGELMAAGDGDRGTMAAVQAAVEAIAPLLPDDGSVVIANKNAPEQTVVSGATDAIDAFLNRCKEQKLRAVKLQVSGAFHSTLVADAQHPLRDALKRAPWNNASIPVFANNTAVEYPVDADAARDLLASQLARPVEFIDQIRAMHAHGARTFVEVGPGQRLSGLVDKILEVQPHTTAAVDVSNGKRSGIADLARCLAHIAARGHEIDLTPWDEGFVAPVVDAKPKFTVPICGANHRSSKPAAASALKTQSSPAKAFVNTPASSPAGATASSKSGSTAAGLEAATQGGASKAANTAPSTSSATSNASGAYRPEGSKHSSATSNASAHSSDGLRPEGPKQDSPGQRPGSDAAPHSALKGRNNALAGTPAFQDAMALMQQNLSALQQLQQQTAQLHKQYLEGQDAAARTLQQMMMHQQQLLGLGGGTDALSQEVVADLPTTPFSGPSDVAGLPAAPFSGPSAVAGVPTAPFSGPKVSTGAKVPPSSQPSPAQPAVAGILLDIIAEKTGYPLDMLELGMTLDGDLGIDSIKRVEILSALQETLPDLPAIEADEIGSLRTVGDIVNQLESSGPQILRSAQDDALRATATASPVADVLLRIVSEKTGYPQDMLEASMSLDADLGIDSIKRVEILSALQEELPELPTIEADELGDIHTLADIIDRLGVSAPLAPAPAVASTSSVSPLLLQIVAEKTGYPESMLDLTMSLDADLGIDSIKRVEILSALQDALPQLPTVEADDIGALRTLGDIVAQLEATTTARPVAPVASDVTTTLLELVADKTGYPVDMLTPDMSLDSDLGIDSIKRVEILSALQDAMPHLPTVEADELSAVRTLRDIVNLLDATASTPTPSATPVSTPVADAAHTHHHLDRSVLKTVALNGLDRSGEPLLGTASAVWIIDDRGDLSRALLERLTLLEYRAEVVAMEDALTRDIPETLAGVFILSPANGATDAFLLHAFQLSQRIGETLNHSAAGGRALFVTLSRMDGRFGLPDNDAPFDALSGGLSGLAKTAGHEWPKVRCKTFDVARQANAVALVESIVDEALYGSEQEVGFTESGRHALRLELTPIDSGYTSPLQPGEVVVVSGGARGVTAEVCIALARASKPTLCLLGRTDAPGDEPAWLAALTDEKEIKQAIVANATAKMSPKELQSAFDVIATAREICATLARIEAEGAKAIYRSVDVRNAAAVATIVDEVRREHGPIRGVIHGAGVLADRLIADKTPEQFTHVYETKIHGLRALLDATRDDDLLMLALFSSSTARFGRKGQVDYAMANEILNKTAHAEARRRPSCRVVSLNWGPWDGGMVTPALKKLFDAEGVGVIDLHEGAEHLVREIAAPRGAGVEIVVLGAGTQRPKPSVAPLADLEAVMEFDLDIERHPFLRSHVIDGHAVLPMAMYVEWFAHAALHLNPGLRFFGANDLRVLKGVILNGAAQRVRVLAGKARHEAGHAVVPVELHSLADGHEIIHARGEIVLATEYPRATPRLTPPQGAPYPDPVYNAGRLFHGETFHGITAVPCCVPEGMAIDARTATPPAQWIHDPVRNTWVADPLALDCAFQGMVLWAFERYGTGCLPSFFGRYRQFRSRYPKSEIRIVVSIVKENPHRAVAAIEFIDAASGELIGRMDECECVLDRTLNAAFQRNQLAAQA